MIAYMHVCKYACICVCVCLGNECMYVCLKVNYNISIIIINISFYLRIHITHCLLM